MATVYAASKDKRIREVFEKSIYNPIHLKSRHVMLAHLYVKVHLEIQNCFELVGLGNLAVNFGIVQLCENA